MSLTTTAALEAAVRTRLLTFIPTGGTSLATQLGTLTGAGSDGKLYLDAAPDGVTYPYAVMRLIDEVPRGDDGRFLRDWLVEVVVYDRPRGAASTPKAVVSLAADTIAQAWLQWSSSDALIRTLPIGTRHTIDYAGAPDPMDRELCAVRLLLPFRGTTTFLAQYAS